MKCLHNSFPCARTYWHKNEYDKKIKFVGIKEVSEIEYPWCTRAAIEKQKNKNKLLKQIRVYLYCDIGQRSGDSRVLFLDRRQPY